jgi:hypothetical protein
VNPVAVEYVLASIATRRDVVDRALILDAQRASHRQSVVGHPKSRPDPGSLFVTAVRRDKLCWLSALR